MWRCASGLMVGSSGSADSPRCASCPFSATSANWRSVFRSVRAVTLNSRALLSMRPAAENRVPLDRLVVGIEVKGEARAYPLMFIGYHHQVPDVAGGEPVLVTYCTVCRTGRVWSPMVNGKNEEFRLVGMDHFNAMFEDATTGSWWRQVNGEAITGKLKGTMLREFPAEHMCAVLTHVP